MNNKKIIIGLPYIKETETKSKLCAEIQWGEYTKTLYFEVDKQYGKYLCTERSDAFLSGLLITAMANGYDIVSKAPVSARLYYQFTSYLIPIVSQSYKYLNKIDIKTNVSNEKINCDNGVGVGFSGGVDSLYSIVKHLNIDTPQFKLTHLLFSSVGTLLKEEKDVHSWFNENFIMLEKTAKAFGLPIIGIFTNLYQFYPYPFKIMAHFGAPNFAACVLALQKLFKVYYHSSGFPIKDFDIQSSIDSATSDVFYLKCLSNENVVFYSAGTEKTRIEKVDYIADNEVVQKNLNICVASMLGAYKPKENEINCGVCKKCMRTICELYSIDKLKYFEDIFYMEAFKKNPQRFIAKMVCMNSVLFSKDIIEQLRKTSKIKPKYYFWMLIYSPFYSVKNLLKKSIVLRKLYYSFNIDIKMQGFRDEDAYNYYKKKVSR